MKTEFETRRRAADGNGPGVRFAEIRFGSFPDFQIRLTR